MALRGRLGGQKGAGAGGRAGTIHFFVLPESPAHSNQGPGFMALSRFPCIQRAAQLSSTLKKIATSQKFTNFHLYYVDFDFQESKCSSALVMTQTRAAARASRPLGSYNPQAACWTGSPLAPSHTKSTGTEIRRSVALCLGRGRSRLISPSS